MGVEDGDERSLLVDRMLVVMSSHTSSSSSEVVLQVQAIQNPRPAVYEEA